MNYAMSKSGLVIVPDNDGKIYVPDSLKEVIDKTRESANRMKELAKWIKMYVGFVPDEGEQLMGQVVFQRTHADRDATLELGLFTNVSPGETITEATLTEPSGGTPAYARITLTDASWSITGGVATYAQQTFTGGTGGWTGSIQGYFIASVSSGGTQRIICIEVDGNGPYTLNENDTYKITPSITFTDSTD